MKILVAGMGKSGFAAADLALRDGHRVAACDGMTSDRLPADISPLVNRGLVFNGGTESTTLLEGVETLILSPGFPRASALVREALSRGIPVLGEVEWAFRHARGRVAAVTGSNGKSTTTSLLGALMSAHLPDVRVGGNLGTPFGALVDGSTDETWFVLELSSFQLESIERFRAHVAVLLNVTPDHMDRYPDFEAYAAAKGRVFANQAPEDWAVFSAFDAHAAGLAAASPARLVPFASEGELPEGAFAGRDRAVWRRENGDEVLFPMEDLPLRGRHNLENALAACVAARCAGVPEGGCAAPLAGFRGLPHRLERLGEVHGAAVYNDSKATNTDAVLKALTAFDSGVVLLLGGKDKGADWASLRDEVRRRCKAVVTFGAAGPKAAEAMRGTVPVRLCPTLREATPVALSMAGPGDSVVLSPACASFDEFENYEDRGERFAAWVREAAP